MDGYIWMNICGWIWMDKCGWMYVDGYGWINVDGCTWMDACATSCRLKLLILRLEKYSRLNTKVY